MTKTSKQSTAHLTTYEAMTDWALDTGIFYGDISRKLSTIYETGTTPTNKTINKALSDATSEYIREYLMELGQYMVEELSKLKYSDKKTLNTVIAMVLSDIDTTPYSSTKEFINDVKLAIVTNLPDNTDWNITTVEAFTKASRQLAIDFNQAYKVETSMALSVTGAKRFDEITLIFEYDETTIKAYYTLNKVIKYLNDYYRIYRDNNKDDYDSILCDALISTLPSNYTERKAYINAVKSYIVKCVRNELKTVSERYKSAEVMRVLSSEYKRIKAETGTEPAKEYWKSFSDNFKAEYQLTFVPMETLNDDGTWQTVTSGAFESTESEAVKNVLLDTLASHPSLTKTERETLNAIRYSVFETGREFKTNQKKLERLIAKAREVLVDYELVRR